MQNSFYEQTLCHSIGEGRGVGPDLKGVSERRTSEWFISFTKDSKSLIESGDKQAVEVFKEFGNMPMAAYDFSDDEIKAILTHIETASGSTETTNTDTKVIADGDSENGEKLFYGSVRFEKRGVACASCHAAGIIPGSTLSKDITNSASAVAPIMSSLPFPAMELAYKNRMLTDSEIADLTAYLKSTSEITEDKKTCILFPVGGVVGFFVLVLLASLIWRKRKKESVNKEIYDRQR